MKVEKYNIANKLEGRFKVRNKYRQMHMYFKIGHVSLRYSYWILLYNISDSVPEFRCFMF